VNLKTFWDDMASTLVLKLAVRPVVSLDGMYFGDVTKVIRTEVVFSLLISDGLFYISGE